MSLLEISRLQYILQMTIVLTLLLLLVQQILVLKLKAQQETG